MDDLVHEEFVGLTPLEVAPASPEASDVEPERFRIARIDKMNDHWLPQHKSGDSAVAESWDVATRRLRDLIDNDPTFQKADAQLTSLVIGKGLHPFAAAKIGDDGAEDEDYNDESDIWFNRWAEEECDAEGEKTLWEMQKLSFSETTKIGSSFTLAGRNRQRPDSNIPHQFPLDRVGTACIQLQYTHWLALD